MNQVVQRSQTPVQRFTPHSPELTGHSLNLEAQCDTPEAPPPEVYVPKSPKIFQTFRGFRGRGHWKLGG